MSLTICFVTIIVFLLCLYYSLLDKDDTSLEQPDDLEEEILEFYEQYNDLWQMGKQYFPPAKFSIHEARRLLDFTQNFLVGEQDRNEYIDAADDYLFGHRSEPLE